MKTPTKILLGTVAASLTARGIGFVASNIDAPAEAHTTAAEVDPAPPVMPAPRPSPTAAMDT